MLNLRASTVRGLTLCFLAFTSLTALAKPGKLKKSPCSSSARYFTYAFFNTGVVQKTGRTQEAPVCVQVIYNPFRFDLFLTDDQTSKAGPDPTSPLTGTAKSTPAAGLANTIQMLQAAVLELQANSDQTQQTISDLKDFLGYVDNSLTNSLQNGVSVALQNAEQRYETVLRAEFQKELAVKRDVHATDVAAGNCPGTLAHPLDGSLVFLIASAQTDAQTQLTNDTTALNNHAAGVTQATIDADNLNMRKLQGIAAVADLYKCGGSALQTLTANINLVDWWRSRLSDLGFAYQNGQPKPSEDIFYVSDAESCSWIFNQDLSDTVKTNGTDQSPLLDNGKATALTSQTFITLKCSSPISLSAGLELSGIRDQEFAIVKSVPSTGGTTSVAKFGYTTNSPVHLLPIAMTNVRLIESQNGRYAGHLSIGVAGNFQGTYSGGSTAEFLIGPSLSLFRTVFLTSGIHIGFQSKLNGGFNVGDTVPTDITAPDVTKSTQVRYGFAITFTKP